MVHFPEILATGIIGLVKPSEFNWLAAAFGLIAIIQVSQFHWYARDENDPSKRFQR